MKRKILAVFATLILIGTIFTNVVYADLNPPPLPVLANLDAPSRKVDAVEVWRDETKILNESLIISNGGCLILDNVNLKMDCTYDNELFIRVEKLGILHIINGSIITTNNTNWHYRFEVYGDLFIDRSTVSYAGGDDPVGGIQIYTRPWGQAVFSDSLISHCDNAGIYCFNSTPSIIGCTLTSNQGYGFYCDNSKQYDENMGNITIELFFKQGWNMISLPVIPENTTAEALFGGLPYYVLYTWNPIENAYSKLNETDHLEVGRGYMLFVMENTVFPISGAPVFSYTTNLAEGWNMIGSVIFNASFVDPDDNPDDSVYNWTFTLDLTDNFTITQDIRPGKGYWVKASNSATLTLERARQSPVMKETVISLNDDSGILCNASHPQMESNRIYSNNGDGIDCVSSTFYISNTNIFNNSNYELVLSSNSHLTAMNSGFNKDDVQINDKSELVVNNNFNLRVIDEDDNNVSNAHVIIKCKNGSKVFDGFTDADGMISSQILTQYIHDASGIEFVTPHTVKVENNNIQNKVNVVMDAPKNIIIYVGGDSDLDTIPDSGENKDNIYWFEGEHHVYDETQILVDGFTSNLMTACSRDDNGEIFNETFIHISNGTYKYYVRARCERPVDNAMLELFVKNYSTSIISDDIHLLTKRYRWYSTPLFTASGNIRLGVKDITSDASVYVDKVLLACMDSYFGQITDPLDHDTDVDCITDGLEVRNTTYWFEAEDVTYTNYTQQCVDDKNASNAKAVKGIDGANPGVFNVSASVDAGDYLCYVRAKNTPPAIQFKDEFDDQNWEDNWDPGDIWMNGLIEEGPDKVLRLTGYWFSKNIFVYHQLDQSYPDYIFEGSMRWQEAHIKAESSSGINLMFNNLSVVSIELRVFAQENSEYLVNVEASVYNDTGLEINSSSEVWTVGRNAIDPNTWYLYRIEKLKNNIKIYVDNILILDYTIPGGEMVNNVNKIKLTAYGVHAEYNKVVIYKQQTGQLDIYGYNSTLGTISTSDWYEWYDLEWDITADGNYNFFGLDSSADIPGVLVDKVMLANGSEIFIDSFADNSIEKNFTFNSGNGETKTTDIKLPADGIVTSATMDINGTSAEVIVTNEANYEHSPAIFEDKVVWIRDPISGPDEYKDLVIKDLSTGDVIFKEDLILGEVAIYGDHVVWSEWTDNTTGWDIYMLKLSESPYEVTCICDATGSQRYPDIYENIVVWQDFRYNNWDIYMYDLDNPIPNGEELTDYNSYDQERPRIDGDRIVWQDNRNVDWDIYMYDLSLAAEIYANAHQTEPELQITDNPNDEKFPDIYGDKIVWAENASSTLREIHMYELITDRDTTLWKDTTPILSIHPRIHGDKIVWHTQHEETFILINESFEGGFPPTGWTTDWWKQSYTNWAGGKAPEAQCYKYDQLNGYDYYDNYIMSKPVNCSGVEKVELEFKFRADIYSNYNCSLYLKYRKNTSSPWVDITPWNVPITSDFGPTNFTIEISGNPDLGDGFQIKWEYIGYYYNFSYWWLDDVRVVTADIGQNNIMVYDLSSKTPLKITDYDNPVNASTPEIYCDKIIWERWTPNTKGDIYLLAQNYTLDLGDDGDINWEHTEVFTEPDTTLNLAGEFNEYLRIHQGDAVDGYINVPLNFASEHPGMLHLTDLFIELEFLTDPLDHDTDGDSLWDGDEFFGFYGYDILEVEDAVEIHAWKHSPLNFIHQTGVCLTTSNGYGDDDTPNINENSWVKLRYHIEDTAQYILKIQPNFNIKEIINLQNIRREPEGLVIGSTGDNTVGPEVDRIDGPDIQLDEELAEYIIKVLVNSTYIKVEREGGDEVEVVGGSFEEDAYIRTLKLGARTGIDDKNASIHGWWYFEAMYNFTRNTDYKITFGIALDQIPDALIPPNGGECPEDLPFENISLVQIIDLDRVRLERQSLDPLSIDADGDTLLDGFEATPWYYPLNPDCDGDGLNDSLEMYGTGTNPFYRDTDLDGVRDAVELGYSKAHIAAIGGEVSSPGSWTERTAHWHTPFNYTQIKNSDADHDPILNPSLIIRTTDPFDFDTDDDGLPDGWIDGWTYESTSINPVDTKTYHTNNHRYKDVDYWRYDVNGWDQSGEMDLIVQIYEGEDLNLDGNCGGYSNSSDWGFYLGSFEPLIDESLINQPPFYMITAGETNPCTEDSDILSDGSPFGDDMPDGYEVWYSHIEPYKYNNKFLLNPIDPSDKDDDLDADLEKIEIFDYEGYWHEISTGNRAYAQFIQINYSDLGGGNYEPDYIPSEIEVNLNMSYFSTPLQLELWAPDPNTGKPPESNDDYRLGDPVMLTGGEQGWYMFDVPDNALYKTDNQGNFLAVNTSSHRFEFYIVLRYVEPGNPKDEIELNSSKYYWHGMDDTVNNYKLKEDGSWEKYDVNFNYMIYSYNFLEGAIGDNLTNLDEYIVGTNPKNKNSDRVRLEPAIDFNDNLSDGEEVGYDPGENVGGHPAPVGGVIFRTNVEDGALKFDNYGSSGSWIDYDGDGSGPRSGTKYEFSKVKENPLESDSCADPENILLFILEDGTNIYLNRTTREELYIWSPDAYLFSAYEDNAGFMRYYGKVYVYVRKSGVDMNSYGPSLQFRNKDLYLASPFDYDSDDDGIPDGHEIKWNEDCERDKNNNLIVTDTLINVRDHDSDDDELLDSQEVAWMVDIDNTFDTDDLENMIDPDSDNDGIWDGYESSWAVNTDGDGQKVSVKHFGIEYEYHSGVNVLDPDSDSDGLVDGYVDGYVWDPSNEIFVEYQLFGNQYGIETLGKFDPWEGEDQNESGGYDFGYETSPVLEDTDRDGLWDGYDIEDTYGELSTHHTDQNLPTDQLDRDTDKDNLPDGMEAYGWDITIVSIDSTYPYNKPTSKKIHVNSNPLVNDTDNDDIFDSLEYWRTNASDRDTDDDGLEDGEEDTNFNGILEKTYGETNPLDQDSDNDGLLDKNETNTRIYIDESDTGTDPWNRDTDGDVFLDGEEVTIETHLYSIDPTNRDSDSDGLLDSVELTQTNPNIPSITGEDVASGTKILTYYAIADPTKADTDEDYLYDGAEPEWRIDMDVDGSINVRDKDSNGDNPDEYDYNQTFVVFRTNAIDTDDDDKLNYKLDTWIAVDPNGAVIKDFQNFPLELKGYSFNESGLQSIEGDEIIIGYLIEDEVHEKEVWTPEGYKVFVDNTSGSIDENIIYIQIKNIYVKYIYNSSLVGSSDYDDSIYSQPKGPATIPNYVVGHQETYDWRAATDLDPDWDEVSTPTENVIGTDPVDADSDDDGLFDGLEIKYNLNVTDPDTDNDGLTDGTELGISEPVVRPRPYGGTDKNATFDGTPTGRKNFTADIDPSTKTDPLVSDTDFDKLFDGWDDDGDGILEDDEEKTGEDLNYDGYVNIDEPDPNDADSDDDGVKDGDDNEGHLDNDDDDVINALDWDSDDDGIFDGTEVGKISPLSDTNISVGHFIVDADPNSTTDPTSDDTDLDGLLDGEEDADFNGAMGMGETNPEDEDTDGDGLWDGPDIGDKLGELTLHYLGQETQDAYTDPLNPDSDGDGLPDGEELNTFYYDQASPGADDTCILQTQTQKYTDPSLIDSDGDGLSDGIEVFGWNVTIIWEKDKKSKGTRTVKCNPTEKDTEQDGLNDYDEFLNSADPERSDTDGDTILDKDEEPGEHAQIEGKDPVLIKRYDGNNIKINIKLKWPNLWKRKKGGIEIKVTVTAQDNAGLSKIRLKISGKNWEEFYLSGEKEREKTATFKAGWGFRKAILDGWDVKAQAYDINGNGAEGTRHINSLIQGASKVLMSVWNAFVEVLTELVSSLFDWIWDLIQGMLDRALQPIEDSIEDFVDSIAIEVKSGYENAGLIGAITGVVDAIFTSSLYLSLLVLVVTFFAIEIIVTGLTAGTSSVLAFTALTFLKTIVISAIIGGLAWGISEVFDRYNDDPKTFFTDVGFVVSAAEIGVFAYKCYDDIKSVSKLDITCFVWGVTGFILVINEVWFGNFLGFIGKWKPIPDWVRNPIINFIIDIIGLALAIKGARDAYKEESDKGTTIGKVSDIVAYVSLAVVSINMLLKYYSDAMEYIGEITDASGERIVLRGYASTSGSVIWDVRLITISTAGGKDWVKFGAAENATNEFDLAYDEPEPPTPPFYPCVQAYFCYPDSSIPALNASYIGNSTSMRWPLSIYVDVGDNNTSTDILLQWNTYDIENVPSEFFIFIQSPNESINMREEHNYTFSATTGYYDFNITVFIDVDLPEISNINDQPDPQKAGGYVNISCDVTDNVGVDEVWVNITYPDSTYHNETMLGGYYYNTTYTMLGTYNYFIWANDTSGNFNVSDIYNFEIILANDPPYTPSNPDPANGSTGIDINAILSWTGGDPDSGDTVTYDVYFSNTSPPMQVVWNQTTTTFVPGTMNFNTTYYWQIVAWDNHGANAEGPIWYFTTEGIKPDLYCDGNLSWSDVSPGSTVTGSFTVKNIGTTSSLLDWNITEWPNWSTWTFNPSSGNDLKPEDGKVTINVSVIAPNQRSTAVLDKQSQKKEFTGEVKIVNLENSSDYCTIPVSLKTSVNRPSGSLKVVQAIRKYRQRSPLYR